MFQLVFTYRVNFALVVDIFVGKAEWVCWQVTRLTLYDNKINTIHPDAFDGLTK